MKVKSNLFSLSANLDSLIAALIGFILIQLFCKHSGIGISPDSVTYLSSSRHLLAGQGFRSFDNLPTADFPIAYPFFLMALSFLTRLDPLQFGCVLNGLLFAGLLYVSGTIVNGFQQSSAWYKRIVLSCLLFSPTLQEVYSMLWSETLFLLLLLFFIICISKYLQQAEMRWLLFSACLCAVVCITRYAGIFLIFTGVVLIWFNSGVQWRKRMVHLLIYMSLSASFFLANILRNLLTTGLAMGPRPRSHTAVLEIMEYFGGVLCDWLLLERTPARAVFLTGAVLLIFLLTIFLTVKKRKSGRGYEYLLAVTGLSYCLFMLVTSALTRYEQFTNRLLSPVFIPLIFCVSWWLPLVLNKSSLRIRLLIGSTALVLTAWFLNIQLAADYEYYDGVKDAGIPGYREDPFVQTAIVQFLEKNKSTLDYRIPIYSNAGDAVYFITGLPANELPFIDFSNKVTAYYSQHNEYLVWFNNEDNPQMPKLEDILRNKNMQLVKQLADGAVYYAK